jgi:hypothetical protein
MSDLLPVQRDLARLLFSLPEAAGYALAGGAALVVQQIVDRDTRDLDAFIAATPGPAPGTVDLLADAFTQAAPRAGWTLQTIRRHPTFAATSRPGRTSYSTITDRAAGCHGG